MPVQIPTHLKKYLTRMNVLIFASSLLGVLSLSFIGLYFNQTQQYNSKSEALTKTEGNLSSISAQLKALESQDQVVINKNLKTEIDNIQKTYKNAVSTYESLLDLKAQSKANLSKLDALYAASLKFLSEKNYASAEAKLTELTKLIDAEKAKLAPPSGGLTAANSNAPASNTAPGSGYSRQKVSSGIGDFVVDIIAADLNSTKVIIDTASDSDCRDSCPVMSLASYAARSGAFAGINGSYFCPASYPQCAGKTNSFDTLLMNRNKTYFNSDNNVYSTVPVAVFGSGWARFIGASSGWGRDTSVDGVIANQPLVLSGGNVAFGGDGDPKKGSKGSRSFIGNKGSTVYIGVVHNATVAEVGHALKALGLENALNLDSGGSTALWNGGYKAGPGRDIPNAVLFVRR